MEWYADIDDARHFPKINSVDLEELELYDKRMKTRAFMIFLRQKTL